jgi:hypothetical protein
MDGRGPSGAAGRADNEDEFLALLREVFRWPEPPETLRADIIRRLAALDDQLEGQSLRTGIPSPDAWIGGSERSSGIPLGASLASVSERAGLQGREALTPPAPASLAHDMGCPPGTERKSVP